MASKGATAELIAAPAGSREKFGEAGKTPATFPLQLEGDSGEGPAAKYNLLQLSGEAFQVLLSAAKGAVLHFEAPADEEKTYTWNAVGILRGRDPELRHSAVLLSAHLDHLGIGAPVNGDNIYNGADDDASGTAAVLELARVLGKGPRPRRTVIFALFGSEEVGGLGSTYFREHPPVPLKEIAANLEFEMIGRPDSLVKADALWLTGWERSNLGPALAAHGAHLGGDPHPAQNFFARSDNYILAKKGVVAQTVSSFGLHKDYHQPSDDLEHLDFKHMDAAIGSLLSPVEWLVNSDFTPKWNKGGQP
jgi:Zn-dependent M28 family amino/carboxypeptidase